MLKKVLTTALFGASVLSVAAANAAAPGVYVTGQLGYAQTHMKDKINPNINSEGNKTASAATSLNNNGLAGRLAIGYQLNQNFAVELGYLRLGSKKTDLTAAHVHDITFDSSSMKLAQHAIDVAAKGIIPISNNFNIYGKLGLAYLTNNISVKGEVSDKSEATKHTTTSDINDLVNIKKRQWAPEVAVGVSYDITPNVAIDTSWTHIRPIGKNRAGNINFASVGISYNFG